MLRFSFKYNIFLKEQTKLYYIKRIALSFNMKHNVAASISVYLCFINNIKHYPVTLNVCLWFWC